jgi:hypothetical protein
VDDYRRLWVTWARTNYSDPQVAAAAVDAAMSAIEHGSIPNAAAIEGHEAAISAGGEYRCRPDRTGAAMAVCVLVALLFIPATLAGLSVNPALGGYVFLAVVGGGPVVAFLGILQIRRNACFFVNRRELGRRGWRGNLVFSAARSDVSFIRLRSGSWAAAMFQRGGDDSNATLVMSGDRSESTDLYWWTDGHFKEFARVAGLPVRS